MSVPSALESLPVGEKLRIVGELWDSIAADQMALPDHSEVIDEVRTRRAHFEADCSSGLSWEQLKKIIRTGRG